ncbi:hypothetical protein D3C81_1197850 [compost metagenome]
MQIFWLPLQSRKSQDLPKAIHHRAHPTSIGDAPHLPMLYAIRRYQSRYLSPYQSFPNRVDTNVVGLYLLYYINNVPEEIARSSHRNLPKTLIQKRQTVALEHPSRNTMG